MARRAVQNSEDSIGKGIIESAFLAHLKCLETLKEGGCDRQCENCLLNVKKYGLTPEEEVSVMFRARHIFEIDEKQRKERLSQGEFDTVVFLVLVFLIVFGFFKACSFTKSVFSSWNKVAEYGDSVPIELFVPVPKGIKQKDGKKFFSDLMNYLNFMRENMSDVVKDGKINCMDYAMFYFLSAEDSGTFGGSVRIFANDAINHVFIGVVIDNKWFFFDPQARRLEDTPMEVFWAIDKRTYDPRYNYDVTDYLFYRYKYGVWNKKLFKPTKAAQAMRRMLGLD